MKIKALAIRLAAIPAVVAAGAAQAAIDVSEVTDALVADGTGAISTVGMALVAMAGVAVVWKWLKASFF